MKLAKRAYVVTLILLTLVFAVSAQRTSDKDARNVAPTVGTGGAVGGPTGLFTVYDGQTLRKGEYTLSIALSNYDRDPGDVDISSIPLSFQVGLSNRLELFFTTEGYRGVKVNSPRNLSGFYLPNSRVRIGAGFTSPPAIVLAPRGSGTSQFNGAVFRPTGAPFTQFPYTGGNAGTFGLQFPFFSGNVFGFGNNGNATLGPPVAAGASANFPGIGSVFGGILPGIVLSTTTLVNGAGQNVGEAPVVFTTMPSYLPDAPFINRGYGTSSFNSFDFGVKWRFNSTSSAVGYGIVASYRWYPDTASDFSGFNMMQRGSGGGANKGDIAVSAFADARLAKWVNMSANVGYTYTGKAKGTFGGSDFTMLDRPDELRGAIALDFPVNKHFQPILELQGVRYVGGRTPNAFERNPLDGLAGIRWFPRRWVGFSFAYRHNFNQQDFESFEGSTGATSVVINCSTPGCTPITRVTNFTGVPQGFVTSSDPHGYIAQFFIGKRDERAGDIVNIPANVDSVTLGDNVVTLPCLPGFRSTSGGCNDSRSVSVTTRASDFENDPLTYNYTVSGGAINGTGANVTWDLNGVQPGTYTVTTSVNDGCGICGKTNVQSITVENCPDCVKVCDCPTLTVTGPSASTSPGGTMTFSASVTSGDVSYSWRVSAGEIISGQGTSTITVQTTREMAGSDVTATATISGVDPTCNCPSEDEETAQVAGRDVAIEKDSLGPAVPDDVKARIDNFYIDLNNDPNARGYIINYGTPAEIRRRKAQIESAISFRQFDRSRITMVDGPDNGSGILTKFYIVPAGADNPTP